MPQRFSTRDYRELPWREHASVNRCPVTRKNKDAGSSHGVSVNWTVGEEFANRKRPERNALERFSTLRFASTLCAAQPVNALWINSAGASLYFKNPDLLTEIQFRKFASVSVDGMKKRSAKFEGARQTSLDLIEPIFRVEQEPICIELAEQLIEFIGFDWAVIIV